MKTNMLTETEHLHTVTTVSNNYGTVSIMPGADGMYLSGCADDHFQVFGNDTDHDDLPQYGPNLITIVDGETGFIARLTMNHQYPDRKQVVEALREMASKIEEQEWL